MRIIDFLCKKQELVGLTPLLHKVACVDDKLTAYDKTVDRIFKKWVFEK